MNNSTDIGDVQFTGDKEEYIELVMILAHFFISQKNTGNTYDEKEFQILCNSLGNYLIPFFKVDITPFKNFEELQACVQPSYNFTRKVIRQLEQQNSDKELFRMLHEKGITPGYEFMAEDIVRWACAAKVADKILGFGFGH